MRTFDATPARLCNMTDLSRDSHPKALSIKGTNKPWSGISSSSCAKVVKLHPLLFSPLHFQRTHTPIHTHCPASQRHYDRHATVSFRNRLSSVMGQYRHYRQVTSFSPQRSTSFIVKTLWLMLSL